LVSRAPRFRAGSPTHKKQRNYQKRYRQHFYILDEPTTGLHFEDIRANGVINTLVDKGNTILIIEHNMDVIKLDYIIDIGPEGGKAVEKS
jgi:excinuclease UvrABC ATPase subunit